MRSEKEMYELILRIAREDERIRAVYMNGSRTNSNAPKDIFQRGDEIEKLGLAIPPAASVAQRLFNMGYDVDKTACTPLETAKTIEKMLHNRVTE